MEDGCALIISGIVLDCWWRIAQVRFIVINRLLHNCLAGVLHIATQRFIDIDFFNEISIITCNSHAPCS